MNRTALVVGGGLAGTTAALALADRGWRVTLAETRPRLGGLAFSFRRASAVGDLTVDNGQHVYLRCCTAYRGFLDRIGGAALAPLQPRLDVPVLDAASGRAGRLRRTALPVPLHLASALGRYPHLSSGERLAVARAAWSMRGLDPDDPALDTRSFGDWLREHGQSERAAEALWDLVGVATLNARADRTSLALAARVFRTGLLTTPGGADIGLPAVPLGDLHGTLATRALERAGVRTLLRTRVRTLTRAEHDEHGGGASGWTAALESGGTTTELTVGTVVLAVPQRQTHTLLPPGVLDAPGRLLELTDAPILNVHVVYDRPVLRRPFLAALGSPVQWVFDRTEHSGLPALPGAGHSQYLALSQSDAGDEIDLPAAELRARYLPELRRLLPAARDAVVRDFFVTRERTATFAPAPGTARLRPGTVTRAPGLFLAGAWTDTGWPATMEGAVRSGLSAARAATGALTHTPARTPIA
uniref:hydroxysqualene dehydroxylase HpnE n=1 Tax=Streptomyces otsuchiensis TaxID=2681388 RepID=UPI001032373B